MLAGVGTTWYTWLEQGRDVRPSDEVLAALAEALRLDAVERRHLLVLLDRPAGEDRGAQEGTERIDAPTRRMLDNLDRQPAFVLGRRWDVLAWNRAADVVFGPYERLVGDERNTLHLLFTDAAHRRLLVDWEAVARASVAMFRADCARHAGDPAFERLVARLTERSPEFARWWAEREVARPLAGIKRIHHPAAGRMHFEYSSLGIGDPPEMKLMVFTPLAEEESVQKLDELLAPSAERRRRG